MMLSRRQQQTRLMRESQQVRAIYLMIKIGRLQTPEEWRNVCKQGEAVIQALGAMVRVGLFVMPAVGDPVLTADGQRILSQVQVRPVGDGTMRIVWPDQYQESMYCMDGICERSASWQSRCAYCGEYFCRYHQQRHVCATQPLEMQYQRMEQEEYGEAGKRPKLFDFLEEW